MNHTELKKIIFDSFSTVPDFPWTKYPNYEVYRHADNKKWFVLIADVPKNKIGLQGTDKIYIANFKCDPIMIGSLLSETGVFPAYHMNKSNWISVALDGSVSDDLIIMLLNMSHNMTSK